ncbi:hypothetical protein [Bradyrhizobium sp. SZCCHNR1093]|uniref:hypothetical protein n=1 Tax=Bradyrhizobium sp. SZCCHNR1093 TaxID=3057368 RepID=UPI0028E7F2DD|nr:hypothetical protein [Bradyrhizobium sp. SZCCHNR1093]
MAYAFDTLGYSKRLQDGGIPRPQADAQAEAARDFIMAELVTKTDLAATKTELTAAIDNAVLRLTVRLGGMVAAGIAALAILERILRP